MLKSSRRYAFGLTAPKIKTEMDFVVFKFIQNEMVPSVFEEAHVELILMTAITVLVAVIKMFSGGARDNRVLVIAREIKSGIFVFSFVPFLVHFSHQLLSVAYTKDHGVYSVIIIVISIGILCIYANHFIRMGQGIRDINYLHEKHVYQQGKVRVEQGLDWAFDSYISMETTSWIRILEFVGYVILTLTYSAGFVLDATSAAVDFFIYIFLLACQIQKFVTYVVGTEERDVQKKMTIYSIAHLVCIILNHAIYCIFWIWSSMSLGAVQFFTWAWYILTLLSLLILLAQLFHRLFGMFIKPKYVELQQTADRENQEKMQSYREIAS